MNHVSNYSNNYIRRMATIWKVYYRRNVVFLLLPVRLKVQAALQWFSMEMEIASWWLVIRTLPSPLHRNWYVHLFQKKIIFLCSYSHSISKDHVLQNNSKLEPTRRSFDFIYEKARPFVCLINLLSLRCFHITLAIILRSTKLSKLILTGGWVEVQKNVQLT